MNPTAWKPVSEGSTSLVTWGFLFLALVACPVFFAANSALFSVREGFEVSRKQKVRVLEGLAEGAAEGLLPTGVLRKVFDLSRKGGPARLRSLLARLERKFPGAIKTLAWDRNGWLLPAPANIQLQPVQLWTSVIQTYLRKRQFTHRLIKDSLKLDSTLKRFQFVIGSQLPITHFLQGIATALPGSYAGKPCLYFWHLYPVDKDLEVAPRPSGSDVGGIVFMIQPALLPEGFWEEFAVRGITHSLPGPGHFLGMLDSRTGKVLFKGKPGEEPGFSERFRQAFDQRTSDQFPVGSWLVAPVETGADGNIRVFLATDLARLFHSLHRQEWLVYFCAALGLGFGFLLMLVFIGDTGRDLPLLWKISGLFAVSIFLPLTGLFHLHFTLVSREKAFGLQEASERMRKSGEALRALFKGFSQQHGNRLFQALSRIDLSGMTEDTLTRTLNDMIDRRVFSNFYLSDRTGSLAAVGKGPVSPQVQKGVRLLLKRFFEDAYGARAPKSPFADAMVDELSEMMDETSSPSLLKFQELREYRILRSRVYFMVMQITVGGQPRTLLIDVSVPLIEGFFARAEYERNRFSRETGADNWIRPNLNFHSYLPNMTGFPGPNPPISQTPELADGLSSLRERLGEVRHAGENTLYYLPHRQEMFYSFRPIFWCSLAPLEKKLLVRRNEFAFTTLLMVGAALFLGFQLGRSLLLPINALDRTVGEVSRGNLLVEISPMGRDEIGRLSRNFNDMVRGLRERERMRAYVSETVLEAVKDETPGPGKKGEIREATILFSDIRNFTTLSETHPAEQIFQMLNDFLGHVSKPIGEHGGRIDKFIGDAVMAVFLDKTEDQAMGAVRAALAMKTFLAEFNRAREAGGLFGIEIGIGINTGKVMMGDVGSEKRKDLTVIGDAVNLAARLEAASKYGKHTKIVIAEATFEKVRTLVDAEEMEIREVKGKHQQVRMFEILGLKEPLEGIRKEGDSAPTRRET